MATGKGQYVNDIDISYDLLPTDYGELRSTSSVRVRAFCRPTSSITIVR